MSNKALEAERQSRKKWLASLLGEPVENVTLADGVEPVDPDPPRCGMGRGARCCVFLICGAEGFACARHGQLHYELVRRGRSKQMNAQRIPEQDYPDCMTEDAT